jgi:hypothetical protein
MMQSAVAESSSLPLVARSVSSAQSALNATASEGADLLFLDPTEVGDDAAGAFVKAVCELVSIPVFIDALRINGVPEQSPGLELLKSGANGLVLTAIDLEKAANGDAHHYVSALMSAVDLAVQQHKEVEPTNSPDGQVRVSFLQDGTDVDGGLHQGAQTITAPSIEVEEPIEAQAKRIVEEERILLTEMVDLVRDASPEVAIAFQIPDQLRDHHSWLDLHKMFKATSFSKNFFFGGVNRLVSLYFGNVELSHKPYA